MNSPITGKKMKAINELREQDGKKYLYQFFQCQDTGESFTTTKLDERNLASYKLRSF